MIDQDLVDGFLAGRAEAAKIVVGWIRTVVENSAWSRSIWKEDVTSDAVYRVLVALQEKRFRQECSLQTYVSRITRYAVIDWIRRERRRAELQRTFAEEGIDFRDASAMFTEARMRAVYDRVWLQIEERCRRLWTFIFYDRLDYMAIAEREQVAVGTIKTWVYRCKGKAVQLANAPPAEIRRSQ